MLLPQVFLPQVFLPRHRAHGLELALPDRCDVENEIRTERAHLGLLRFEAEHLPGADEIAADFDPGSDVGRLLGLGVPDGLDLLQRLALTSQSGRFAPLTVE